MYTNYNESGYHYFNNSFISYIGQYIDLDYSIWLWRALTPLIITFMLPMVFVLLIYLSSCFLYIYKLHRRVIYQAVSSDDINYWNVARKCVAAVWDAHAWIYHGYEVTGMEYLPKEGPALIVYYHGAIPIDMYYFVARVCMERDRLIHTVADRFLFKLPGWGIISEAMKVCAGTVQTCSNTLREGNLLAISPGGVYEAQFGNNNYELLWKNRVGFAKVAIDAKAPIIPMFTENLREGFRSVNFMQRWFIKLYNKTKFPMRPIYGGFPVKFRTHLGPPIEYDPKLTPEQLQEKVALAIEDLISKHQRIPGSILHALADRFYNRKKKTK
ncbi:transmembrane protein 68 [Sitodiplosis mosellana]|uniref:transmembrane protein 68 n=1 Tax=Sitodiplosis mosellana TaxID=263140 RepID=UPI00244520CE|nr:transmembrane protein 68 [Sitodiplosis mosellana]